MKILNKLTIKHLLMNKKRTIVTIIGVILSTSLMVGIGLIFSSFRDSLIRDAKYYNGSQHVIFYNINEEQSKIIENNVKIESYLKLNYFDSYIKDDKEYQIINIDIDSINKISDNKVTNKNEIVIPKNIKNSFGNEIEINDEKYNVVGIIDDVTKLGLPSIYNDYIYTTDNEINNNIYFITFKDVKNAHKYIDELKEQLDLTEDDINTNTELLAYNGSVKYSNIMNTITNIIIIVLALISVGCIIVIYNSFAISVMERKKQFGLFSSIGTTKSQLIKTVYFEAIIISLIGIPLGILASYLGIGIVIKITNSLLSLDTNLLELSTYPLFIIIPIIFMIITIILSAFIPALSASRVSPIEAIRMNDDIKIKSKKVKTPKFIIKLFGVEGDLALKNIKRNKKKYRVTIISLFISIVLFITFSSFINYVIGGVKYMTETPEFDIAITGDIGEKNKKSIISSDYTDEYLDMIAIPFVYKEDKHAMIYLIDDNTYNKTLSKLGKIDKKPIVANNYKKIEYDGNSRVVKIDKKFKNKEEITLKYDNEILKFNDYYLVDDFDNLLDTFMSEDLYLIMTKDMLENYSKYQNDYTLIIKSKQYNELFNYTVDLLELDSADPQDYERNISVYNMAEAFRLEKNIIIVIKIFVYGFIALVTLIGVTSVINTINTSIALRRKEFAILRSIGLTKKGFNKMIYFESLFFGLKSLLYALPVSGIIIYFIHKSMTEVIAYQSIMLPIMQMIYAIIGVFVIVLLTMLYASRKIKKDNILEAIREENI